VGYKEGLASIERNALKKKTQKRKNEHRKEDGNESSRVLFTSNKKTGSTIKE